jgi:hypothetical protein
VILGLLDRAWKTTRRSIVRAPALRVGVSRATGFRAHTHANEWAQKLSDSMTASSWCDGLRTRQSSGSCQHMQCAARCRPCQCLVDSRGETTVLCSLATDRGEYPLAIDNADSVRRIDTQDVTPWHDCLITQFKRHETDSYGSLQLLCVVWNAACV